VVTSGFRRIAPGSWVLPWFQPQSRYSVARDGCLYRTLQDGIDIDVLSSSGTPVRRIRFEARHRAVTHDAVDSIMAWAERSARENLPPAMLAEQPPLGPHPHARYRPVVGQMLAGDAGLLLVQRTDLSPVDTETHGSAWDLIRSDGSMLGRMQMPGRFEPRVVQRDRITGIARDAMDVPSIVQYGWDSDRLVADPDATLPSACEVMR
jgi:hypothetical protein